MSLDSGGGSDEITIATAGTWAEGDKVSLRIGDQMASYTVSAADAASTTPDDLVAVGLKNAIEALGIADLTVDYDSANPGELVFTTTAQMTCRCRASSRMPGSGGLSALNAVDVSTAAGATAALGNIENLIQTAIDAAAEFGSVEGRIETQSKFISALSDSLKSGIGSLVDADMEETSARLQALQVQQQLGVQSLSIANQAPQSILSLFR